MNRDPIVEEIRKVRDAHAAENGYDVERIALALQEEEKKRGLQTVERQPKPSRHSRAG